MVNNTVTELQKLQRRIANCEQHQRHTLTLSVTEARMLLAELEQLERTVQQHSSQATEPVEIHLVGEPF